MADCQYKFQFPIQGRLSCPHPAYQNQPFGEVHLPQKRLEQLNFQNANLHKADLQEGFFQGANFCKANLSFANLRGADFRNANFKGADLSFADLMEARFDGAVFTDANLYKAKLIHEDLKKAITINAHITPWQQAPPHDFPEGYIFGRQFEVLSSLGRGSFGYVYKVRQLRSSSLFAIKILNPIWSNDSDTRKRFKRQAEMIKDIEHPNIVKIYHLDHSEGCLFIVMEYLEGDNLLEMEKAGKSLSLSMDQKIAVFRELVSALKELAHHHILHRDLKPSNIMILKDGKVKLLDFELAKFFDLSTITSDQAPGTVKYWSPEHILGADCFCEASDVFSLGLVIYEFFTGSFPKSPKKDETFFTWNSSASEPIPPSLLNPSIPSNIEKAIMACLQKDLSRRCRSFAELEQLLITHSEKRTLSIISRKSEIPPLKRDVANMVLIPEGEFIFGCDEKELIKLAYIFGMDPEDYKEETPSRRITLPDFFIDKFPVTNKEYYDFIVATGYPPPFSWRGKKPPDGIENHPVTGVSFYDAQAYAHWKGKRLPTPEEWEKAARGGAGLIFPWGNEFFPDRCNYGMRWKSTTPIGSFPKGKSSYGCLDMVGNVWEWTSRSKNNGQFYCVKGGSWVDEPMDIRPSINFFVSPKTKAEFIGFRCASSIKTRSTP